MIATGSPSAIRHRLVDDAGRSGSHATNDPVLSRRHGPFELARYVPLAHLEERQVALERENAKGLRLGLGAPQLIAGPHRAGQPTARAGDRDEDGVDPLRSGSSKE